MTLVEVLIVLAVVCVSMGLVLFGSGVTGGARLRRSSVMIASAIRIAYGHANATSKSVRLVFNFEARTVAIEESSSQLTLAKGERTGGAQAATQAERRAIEEAEAILKGPRAPRPSFRPVKAFGFDPEKGLTGKMLERDVRFLQIETAHEDTAATTDQAYLYFWPGGQTERASIQLTLGRATSSPTIDPSDVVSIVVSPLTGKAEIKKGKIPMPRPRDDVEESERRDTGF